MRRESSFSRVELVMEEFKVNRFSLWNRNSRNFAH
jgi:hypothetical protein